VDGCGVKPARGSGDVRAGGRPNLISISRTVMERIRISRAAGWPAAGSPAAVNQLRYAVPATRVCSAQAQGNH
jgi:hypothetical protein